ncbi:hypothetical protein ACTXT7_001476 [Hymenolepis weldensis]
MSKKTQENRSMCAKPLLNKLKHPEGRNVLGFSSTKKTSTRIKKLVYEVIGGYVRPDPTEVPTVMHEHEVYSNSNSFGVVNSKGHIMTPSFFPRGLRINADVYVETLG